MSVRKSISPSQLDAMSCRFAWYLGYAKGYRAKKSSTALELGTGIHAALEAYYKDKADPVAFFEQWTDKRLKELDLQWEDEINEAADSKKLGIAMLQNYISVYDGKDDFDVIATERTLRRALPIPEELGKKKTSRCDVVVRLDGLVRDRSTGKLFSLEHKTFSRFSLSQLELNHQFIAQVWVGQCLAEEMGLNEPVIGVIYNGIRKQAPGPKVKNALLERHKIYCTDNQIAIFLYRAYWQYREANRKGFPIFPQPNAIKCGQCDFKNVCIEYQRGGDWKFILRESFIQRNQDTIEQKVIAEDDSEE